MLELELWRNLIAQRSGLWFSPNRDHLLLQALKERMDARKIGRLLDYYHLVMFQSDPSEWSELQEKLLNHETSFFRHPPTFEALRTDLLPELLQRKITEDCRTLMFWSAGCSTGQEAYSLGIFLTEQLPPYDGWQFQITATDLSPEAIRQAKQGWYRPFEIRGLNEEQTAKYLTRKEQNQEIGFQMNLALRKGIYFQPLNLCDPDAPFPQGQDLICCQNVLIYFAAPTRNQVLRRFAESLNPGGFLLLGPADQLGVTDLPMEPIVCGEVVVYVKKGLRLAGTGQA